jgi:ATP-dependent DNA helicase RecQ
MHYYQQVGRAGRAVSEAYGVLLHGDEDEDITDYFISKAFPPQAHVTEILKLLDESEGGLSVPQLEASLNLRRGDIDKALKYLSVESPSPVVKIQSKWNVTASSVGYSMDQEAIAAITEIRYAEQERMAEYMSHSGCLMEFLSRELDDPAAAPCGRCAGCLGGPLLPVEVDGTLVNRAGIFLRRSYQPLEARKMWPAGDAMPHYGFSGRMGDALRVEEGRALSLWRDAGWGQLVAKGKYETERFDDSLVTACVELLAEWAPTPFPEWVTCIPSLKRPELVPGFTARLAEALQLPFFPCLEKAIDNPPQKEMQNSFMQAHNLDGAFRVNESLVQQSPCLLVDDMRDSGWTFTVAGALLRRAGVPAVFPLALALNSTNSE